MNAFNILEVTLKDITDPEHFVNKGMRQNSSQTLVVRVIDHKFDAGENIDTEKQLAKNAALFIQNVIGEWELVKDPVIEWSPNNDDIEVPRNVTKINLSVE